MAQNGRSWNGTSDNYRYGMSGKEKLNEWQGNGNSYDFGARVLDPRLGRWLAVDPLKEKYPGLNPYNFVANSPIKYLDPDGKGIIPADTKAQAGFQTQINKNFSGELAAFNQNISYETMGSYKDMSGNTVEIKGFVFKASDAVPNPEVLAFKIKQSNASDEQKAKAIAYSQVVSSVDAYVVSDATSTKEEQKYSSIVGSNSGAEAEKNHTDNKNAETKNDLTGGDTKYQANERSPKDKEISNPAKTQKDQIIGAFSIDGSTEENLNKTVGQANEQSNQNKPIKGKVGEFKDKMILLTPKGKVEAKPSTPTNTGNNGQR